MFVRICTIYGFLPPALPPTGTYALQMFNGQTLIRITKQAGMYISCKNISSLVTKTLRHDPNYQLPFHHENRSIYSKLNVHTCVHTRERERESRRERTNQRSVRGAELGEHLCDALLLEKFVNNIKPKIHQMSYILVNITSKTIPS